MPRLGGRGPCDLAVSSIGPLLGIGRPWKIRPAAVHGCRHCFVRCRAWDFCKVCPSLPVRPGGMRRQSPHASSATPCMTIEALARTIEAACPRGAARQRRTKRWAIWSQQRNALQHAARFGGHSIGEHAFDLVHVFAPVTSPRYRRRALKPLPDLANTAVRSGSPFGDKTASNTAMHRKRSRRLSRICMTGDRCERN